MGETGARSLLGARWVVRQVDEQVVRELAAAAGIRLVTARALSCRGITDARAAQTFLGHDLAGLVDPFLMADMPAAVDTVDDALRRGVKIRIYGDYDVDGVCATALLVRALSRLGGHVDWYIPHRIDEGYGLHEEAVRRAHEDGVELLITVDCGSTAVDPVATARHLGMKVVVTDHHRPGDQLPEAPVLNPCRCDCAYPFKELAGVGVAFKLVSALARAREVPDGQELNFLDLVCLGTVADVVPLLGENRLFVQHGLRRLSQSRKIGIQALMKAAGLGGGRGLGARDVAFGLAPRINAAGRMEDARAAVRLLLTHDPGEASHLAAELSRHNDARQAEEREALARAEEMVASRVDLTQEKVIVLGSEEWHPGVIGIVASRLVERYHRPALLVAVSDGLGKGSGRSIAPLNLWEALKECASVLTRFGGHHYAAGFGIEASQIEELRRRINQFADQRLTQDDLQRQIEIDAEASVEDLTLEAVQELNRLAPFGMGNPTPMLATRAAVIADAVPVGGGSHLALHVTGPSGESVEGIWFRAGHLGEELQEGQAADVCYRARLDEWNGAPRVKLHVTDIAVHDSD